MAMVMVNDEVERLREELAECRAELKVMAGWECLYAAGPERRDVCRRLGIERDRWCPSCRARAVLERKAAR